MSEYVARELEDIDIEIHDECGGIVRTWKEYDANIKKMDPQIECPSPSYAGATYQILWTKYCFIVKPGFMVEANVDYLRCQDDSHGGEYCQPTYTYHYSQWNCYECGRIGDLSLQQDSEYNVFFACQDGQPVVDHNFDTWSYSIIENSPVIVTVTPLFSGSGILRGSNGMPLTDESGRILTAG